MVTKELVYQEYEELCTKYKKLLPPQKLNNGWKIDGEFDVVDSDGYNWATYAITIEIPEGFPFELPILKETRGEIEPTPDWHNNNGICCLATNAIIYKELGTPISLLKWMNRFVHDYLANHVIKLKDNTYPNGEYPHGEEGMIVGYKEIFGLETESEVMNRLNLICKNVSLGRNEKCFCNSGKKYKRCFLLNPKEHYYNIPINVLNTEREQILKWLMKKGIIK
ncbi:MAG: hypothetical protein HEQ40_17220 [Lacibacter sp.]|jgi:hypothetical protein